MSENPQDRLSGIISSINKKNADAEARRQKEVLEKKRQQDVRAAAPARWQEHWQIFRDLTEEINGRISSVDLRIVLQDLPTNVPAGSLAVFQIFLFQGDQKSDHFYTCTIGSQGGLSATRRLPGLTDSDGFAADKMNRETIRNFLLDFLENARGLRSMQEMMSGRNI